MVPVRWMLTSFAGCRLKNTEVVAMVVAMVAKVGKEALEIQCRPFPPPEIAGLKGRLIHHHHPLTRPGLRSGKTWHCKKRGPLRYSMNGEASWNFSGKC